MGPLQLLSIVLFFLAVIVPAQGQDADILNQLKAAWPGLETYGWNGTCEAGCPWHGVQWDGQQRVVTLDISARLEPPASFWPDALWTLTSLSSLRIRDQELPCLSNDITAMSNLKSLSLLSYTNWKNCTLPSALTSSMLPTLRSLYLQDATGGDNWPTELYELDSLTRLDIYNSKMDMGTFLDFSPNNFPNLTSLTLSMVNATSNLRAFPTDYQSGRFQTLDLWRGFTGPFQPFVSVPDLFNFRLREIDFEGDTFPSTQLVGPSLCKLDSILLRDTNFSADAFPTSIIECSQLRTIDITGNSFSGPIPTTIGTMSALETLRCSDCDLAGSIPSELGNVQTLQDIDLSDNLELTGVIPAELGNLTRLHRLVLRGTGILGPLPSELANAKQLQYLEIQNTPSLVSEVPEEWAFLPLKAFNLQDAVGIHGLVPGWVLWVPGEVEVGQNNNFTDCLTEPRVYLPNDNQIHQVNENTYVHAPYQPLWVCNPCAAPRPFPTAACYRGKWTAPGGVQIQPGETVVLNSPVWINGDFNHTDGATLQISLNGSVEGRPLVNVTGSATVSGKLEIVVDSPPTSELVVLTSVQISGQFSNISVVDHTGGACPLTAQQTVTGSSISVLMTPDSACTSSSTPSSSSSSSSAGGKGSRLSPGAIAGIAAGAVVFLAVVVLVIALVLYKQRIAKRLFIAKEDDFVVT